MPCGCQGGGARRTVTTADVQAKMGTYTVTADDGEELYSGSDYLSALRAKNGNRSRGAKLSTG